MPTWRLQSILNIAICEEHDLSDRRLLGVTGPVVDVEVAVGVVVNAEAGGGGRLAGDHLVAALQAPVRPPAPGDEEVLLPRPRGVGPRHSLADAGVPVLGLELGHGGQHHPRTLVLHTRVQLSGGQALEVNKLC